jgi:putative acetyltransferase
VVNGLTLKIVKICDLEEMKRLFFDTISSLCAANYNEDQIKVWMSAVENRNVGSTSHKQYFIIAEIETKIVGVGSLESGSYLYFLYVYKNHQRQEIAKAILTKLERDYLPNLPFIRREIHLFQLI